MFGRRQETHASVYLLSDHLDAILAAGEDVLAARTWIAPALKGLDDAELHQRAQTLAGFVQGLQARELSIAAHLRLARQRAKDLQRADRRFASLIKLFLASTAALEDVLADLRAPAGGSFHSGGDLVAFFRSRAVIGPESPGLADMSELAPSESFMVAGQIELGPLMDLAAAFLNSLDTAYDLYGDDGGGEIEAMPDRSDDADSVGLAGASSGD